MPIIVDGKSIAEAIQAELKEYTSTLTTPVSFHIIYVGSDPVIDTFIKYKEKFGGELGVNVTTHRFDEDISFNDLTQAINVIESTADAMIIQLPLPPHLRVQSVLDIIPCEKDVDMLSTDTRRRFRDGGTTWFPPVTGSIIEIIRYHHISLMDKKILLIGNGSLVGYPMSLWLDREGYAYDIITKETDEDTRTSLLLNADIIISGAGVPGMITKDMVKEGVVLIDAGTSESGKKIIGDVDYGTYHKASLVTPVPGGIGPITIAVLYRNIISAHKHHHAVSC
ncbi:bifunctional 5,10-methylenetetrahydrofolate dehydrogenase/5,10-methenyltetrahydrofolate cyclohydrolase [Patescibacteria group bacterium]|nr:bifunctional 5,10-methylenetetrahydrofolate dehydrogenase/5,10-methenyltetrahydrofolate cyclohydrolase [Patescibacteria group bacterium]